MDRRTDLEAERRVLSAILHSDTACIEAFNRIADNDFSYQMHREVFNLAFSLYSRGVIPTYVEVIKEGNALGWLETREDLIELQHIAEQYIDDRNIKYWLDRVVDSSKARQAQQLLMKYGDELQNKGANIPDLIQNLGSEVMAIALDSDREQLENAESIAELGAQTIADNVHKWRRFEEETRLNSLAPLPLEGLATGLEWLDNLTLGYKPGDLIILGAQTGHGKTAFALNTAKAACVEGKRPVLYINTEMSRKQITYRWAAILSGISLQKIRKGALTDAELFKVKSSLTRFSQSKLYTTHMPNLTPYKLQIITRKAKLQNDIEMLILDYVGRMEKTDGRLQEWQVLEQIVKSMKIMAQNLNIACLVLVQLNDDGSLQGAKRMKNECDLMLKLFPVEKEQAEKIREYHKTRYEPFDYRLHIDKSRDSVAGVDIPIVFNKACQQIREAKDDVWGAMGTWKPKAAL